MIRFSRGAALVETALSISVALIIVLGAGQMAIIGYTQIAADGAAFVASHDAASNPGGNSITTAKTVFTQFGDANFSTPSPAPKMDPTLVTATVSGFSLLPGLSAAYTVQGKDVEYQAAGANATASMYAFSSPGSVLLNYCAPPGTTCTFPSNYSIGLLGSPDIITNGNGNNGPFAQWRCRQKIYSRIGQSFNHYAPLPGGYSNIQKSNLDVYTSNSDEAAVYGWDTGSKCT
ncbi:MAG: TadE family protein [Candidatus Baltobacteraceae bacterium]